MRELFVSSKRNRSATRALYHLCGLRKLTGGTSPCAGPNFTDFLPASNLPDQYSVYAPNWKARLLIQCGGDTVCDSRVLQHVVGGL